MSARDTQSLPAANAGSHANSNITHFKGDNMRQLLIAVALNALSLILFATGGQAQTMDPFSQGYYGGLQSLVAPEPQPINYEAQRLMLERREAALREQRYQQQQFQNIVQPLPPICIRTVNGSIYCPRAE